MGTAIEEETVSTDVAPVIANKPQDPKRTRKRKRSSDVARVLGKVTEDFEDEQEDAQEATKGIFPEDAEEVEGKPLDSATYLKGAETETDEEVQEEGPEEELITPEAAMVAPDVTPQIPASPASIPDMVGDTFTSADAAAPPPQAEVLPPSPTEELPRPDSTAGALDALLGRNRPRQPGAAPAPRPAPSMAATTPPMESLKAQFESSIKPPADPTAAMVPGQEMPVHESSDGSKVVNAWRRFSG